MSVEQKFHHNVYLILLDAAVAKHPSVVRGHSLTICRDESLLKTSLTQVASCGSLQTQPHHIVGFGEKSEYLSAVAPDHMEEKDAYICYNSNDLGWVKALAEQLESETIDGSPSSRYLQVFFDRWDMGPGAGPTRQIFAP